MVLGRLQQFVGLPELGLLEGLDGLMAIPTF
jgi:hypothetical protein